MGGDDLRSNGRCISFAAFTGSNAAVELGFENFVIWLRLIKDDFGVSKSV